MFKNLKNLRQFAKLVANAEVSQIVPGDSLSEALPFPDIRRSQTRQNRPET